MKGRVVTHSLVRSSWNSVGFFRAPRKVRRGRGKTVVIKVEVRR